MSRVDSTQRPWHLADVGQLLTATAARVALAAGVDAIAVVDTSVDRRLLAAEALRLRRRPRRDPEDEVWRLGTALHPVLERLCGVDLERPPGRTIHLIQCREGRVVPPRDEAQLGWGLRYGMNLISAYMGELITVTPHGWRCDERAGATPTLNDLATRHLRAV